MKRKKAKEMADALIETDALQKLDRERLGDLLHAVVAEEVSRRMPGHWTISIVSFSDGTGWSLGDSYVPLSDVAKKLKA